MFQSYLTPNVIRGINFAIFVTATCCFIQESVAQKTKVNGKEMDLGDVLSIIERHNK
jgi:hypothetical protein